MVNHLVVVGVAGMLSVATAATAQRIPFERSIDINGPATLDLQTDRGRIDVQAGAAGRIVIAGVVTIRSGWNVPANAAEIARRVADRPPIEHDGDRVRLRVPTDPVERRAVTVSYVVRVPPHTNVLSVSDSGATAVSGVIGTVDASTQSSAITLTRLGSTATVKTGSGAILANDITGALTVTTSSSSVTGRGLQGDVRIKSQSGAVDAMLTGDGDVDVETGSSAIRVCGAQGGVNATTESGHISIAGKPTKPWKADTGSGGMDIGIDRRSRVSVSVASRSGKVRLDDVSVQGELSERRVTGTVSGGGPLLRAESRSGSINVSALDGRGRCY